MYDAFPDLPTVYDSVPVHATRPDVQFYVDEAGDAGGSVLEIGCGTGRVLLPIARAGHTITGVDASRYMLERCQTKLRAEPGEVQARVTLHLRDARSFDLGRKFDLVTAPFRVVQHLTTIEDQLGFLGSVSRHLAPGGRLAFDVFNPNFAILVSAGGMEEREDTPETTLPDGRRFRRAGRVSRVRWIDQVSEVELVHYITGPTEETERRCCRSRCEVPARGAGQPARARRISGPLDLRRLRPLAADRRITRAGSVCREGYNGRAMM